LSHGNEVTISKKKIKYIYLDWQEHRRVKNKGTQRICLKEKRAENKNPLKTQGIAVVKRVCRTARGYNLTEAIELE